MENHLKSVISIVVARMDSKRLPNKALLEVCGVPLIAYVFKRASLIKGSNRIVLATTDRKCDDALCDCAAHHGVDLFRGDLDNVSRRLLLCAQKFNADYFVRLNGDSPFVDYDLISNSIRYCLNDFDLITNIVERTFPYGISVEIIKTSKFYETCQKMKTPSHYENVTKYYYEHLNDFYVKSIKSGVVLTTDQRFVVDNEHDLRRFKEMVQFLGNRAILCKYQELVDVYNRLYVQCR